MRQLRTRIEVTLQATNASEETKKTLAAMSPKQITERCQQAIDKSQIEGVKLRGVNKLAKSDIRLQCESEEKAKRLQEIDWNSVFKDLKARKATFGLVIHGVLKEEINLSESNTTAVLQQENTNVNITKVTSLRRKPNTEAKHHSIIVFTEDSAAADKCIKEGFYINYRRYQPQRYVPYLQVIQYFNYGDYGHRAVHCKQRQKCGKCAEEHHIGECTSEEIKCILCEGNHEVWHFKCPARIAESQRLAEVRNNTSDYYLTP